tara:strand:- start:9295 stop:9537 length:243 start_codon:yes stop_codon:yes gene_type:complete
LKQPLEKSDWKFIRMRPSNFTLIRIAQFVALFIKKANLFQAIVEAKQLPELQILFNVETYPYFDTHYRFEVPAIKKQQKN